MTGNVSVIIKRLNYICNLNVTHEYIICDKTKVREIFMNIVSNSIKYTKPGGNVSMEVNETGFDNEKGVSFEFVIRDTGLGLPIVKSLVDLCPDFKPDIHQFTPA